MRHLAQLEQSFLTPLSLRAKDIPIFPPFNLLAWLRTLGPSEFSIGLHLIIFANPSHSLPIFALVDCDPDGLSILDCYMHGSRKNKHSSDMEGLALGGRLIWMGLKGSEWSE